MTLKHFFLPISSILKITIGNLVLTSFITYVQVLNKKTKQNTLSIMGNPWSITLRAR